MDDPTPFARMVATNLDAAERNYRTRIAEINAPIIELLRKAATKGVQVSDLADFLSSRRLSEVALDDYRILGDLWEGLRKKRPNIELMSWDEYTRRANSESEKALVEYHEQVRILREYGKSMSDKH